MLADPNRYVVVIKGTRVLADGFAYGYGLACCAADERNARARALGIKARYDIMLLPRDRVYGGGC